MGIVPRINQGFRSLIDLIHPDYQLRFSRRMATLLKTHKEVVIDFLMLNEIMQLEDPVLQTHKLNNAIISNAPGGFFIYQADKNDDHFTVISQGLLLMLGYTEDEFRKKFHNRFSQMVCKEDRKKTLLSIENQIKVSSFDNCCYRIEKKDGSYLPVYDEGHIVSSADGNRYFYVVIVDNTQSEKTKSTLGNQNKELTDILARIPAKIAVYARQEGQVKILAANGFEDTILKSKSSQDLLAFVYKEDCEKVRAFFLNFFNDHLKQGELTYRIVLTENKVPLWQHCSAISVPQKNGEVLIYAVYTDATGQIQREAEFSKSIEEILTANPDSLCTFRLNLTTNVVIEGHGVSEYIKQLLTAKTADELLDKITAIITDPQDSQKFHLNYSRQALLEDFRIGKTRLAMVYRQMTDSGKSHWIKTFFFHLLRNPGSGDIEAVAYSLDYELSYRREKILSLITGEEYDYIGLVDSVSGRLTYYFISDDVKSNLAEIPLDFQPRTEYLSSFFKEPERSDFVKTITLANVKKTLEEKEVFTVSYTLNGRRKQTLFRYLDKDQEQIMVSSSDVTDSFTKEEANADQLRKALLNAEKANEMKSDFLGNVFHDMRTPLNAILGYNSLAEKVDNLPDKVKEYLEKIGLAGNTLLALINDTLDLQKIETGLIQLKPEPIRCDDFLNEINATIQPLMARKNLTFVIEKKDAYGKPFLADIIRLREIFINLLSNAEKIYFRTMAKCCSPSPVKVRMRPPFMITSSFRITASA
jgi:PAS domain S-box-containing protein